MLYVFETTSSPNPHCGPALTGSKCYLRKCTSLYDSTKPSRAKPMIISVFSQLQLFVSGRWYPIFLPPTQRLSDQPKHRPEATSFLRVFERHFTWTLLLCQQWVSPRVPACQRREQPARVQHPGPPGQQQVWPLTQFVYIPSSYYK